uniref:GLOBIN domain-containing protein n=1 Tax=Steinernema glaseri TaxID=37863 RepID=A0A1I7Z6J7_9BILA
MTSLKSLLNLRNLLLELELEFVTELRRSTRSTMCPEKNSLHPRISSGLRYLTVLTPPLVALLESLTIDGTSRILLKLKAIWTTIAQEVDPVQPRRPETISRIVDNFYVLHFQLYARTIKVSAREVASVPERLHETSVNHVKTIL